MRTGKIGAKPYGKFSPTTAKNMKPSKPLEKPPPLQTLALNPPQPKVNATISRWSRFLAWLGVSHKTN